ncbi:MAG: HAD family hydrolase [Ignavibacteria bacterium]|nr:HAD family hydrolase [Ignavibacteria bacterium]
MQITHIAFDLDGVLFTAAGFIESSYADAIKLSGINREVPSAERIIKNFGKPGADILKDLFGELSESEQTAYRKHLIENIVNRIMEGKGELFTGIENTLISLSKSYTLAVCSNGSEDYISTVLECKNIKKYFIPLLTLNNTSSKTKSELLKNYLIKTSTAGENWILFGDRLADLTAARSNNCYFIGCNWGFAEPGELTGSDIIINKPIEIENTVKNFRSLILK